jgi:ATP-binding cassette subfamily C protein
LIDLLLGVIEPSSGKVTISGVEPREAFKIWPGSVGYVPQQIVIASGSVAENVALGFKKLEINFLKVKECLLLAGLEEFASEDLNGLSLEVGEAGYRLSGGQRQRIGIARALYTSPRLLVLDEATSSLDSLTEFDITNSLSRIKQKMSMITIAHRLSTVKMADEVIFMKKGHVLASGSFDEVRAKVKTFDKQANLLGL